MKRIFLLGCVLIAYITPIPLKGQTIDSIPAKNNTIHIQKHTLKNKFRQTTHIGAPLILIGALTYHKDLAFKDMRNSYIPRFHFHYDDYLQYSPGVIMFGLKSFGVEGRSSWGRMLTSDAFSAGIMALTVNTLKNTIHKERPDKSGNNSFPSGHTATAFMFATMLHKEYGTTRSPLYSILGYSLATGTALSRQINNKHWFSDVLTGAGIGIVSTELGYYLADLIFKKKGIVRPPLQWKASEESDSFSFLGLQMGYAVGERKVHLPENIELEGLGGATASLTGAWFFRSHWGVGGKFSVTETSPHIANDAFFNAHPNTETSIERFEARSMSYTNLVGGVHYNVRITPGLYTGGSIMGGVGWTSSYHADIRYKDIETTVPLIHCNTHPIPNLDLTAYIMHVTGRNLGIKLYINYNTGIGKGNYTYYPPEAGQNPIPVTGSNRIILHNLYIGAEVDALFWK